MEILEGRGITFYNLGTGEYYKLDFKLQNGTFTTHDNEEWFENDLPVFELKFQKFIVYRRYSLAIYELS